MQFTKGEIIASIETYSELKIRVTMRMIPFSRIFGPRNVYQHVLEAQILTKRLSARKYIPCYFGRKFTHHSISRPECLRIYFSFGNIH